MADSKPKVNKNEYTLKSGRKIKFKTLTLDLRDELLDTVEFVFDKKGKAKGVAAIQKTITYWQRNFMDGDIDDNTLISWTPDERTEFFDIVFHKHLFVGEGKPSN